MEDLQPVIDVLKQAITFIKDSGLLEKAIAAIKEYLPKIIELVSKLG